MNCSFKTCTASGNGGALSVSGFSKSLIVDCCSFTTCGSNSSNGGAIYCSAISTFIVKNSSQFISCSAVFDGGAVVASNVTSCFCVHTSTFSNCITSEGSGGGMYLQSCTDGAISSMCVNESDFRKGLLYGIAVKGCNASLTGGGICLSCLKEGYAICSSRIVGCTSLGCGGGVNVSIDLSFGSYATIFEFVFFGNNTATGKSKGHDISFCQSSGTPFTLERGPFDNGTCYTTTPMSPGKEEYYATLNEEKADGKWLPLSLSACPMTIKNATAILSQSSTVSLSIGAIVGIVVGCAVVVSVVLLSVVLFALWKSGMLSFKKKMPIDEEEQKTAIVKAMRA